MSDNSGRSQNRYQGILTEGDYECLFGGRRGDGGDTDRGSRLRMRKRIESAIRDITYLTYYLDEEDREMLFKNIFQGDSVRISQALAFFHLGCLDLEEEIDGDWGESTFFEEEVREAVMISNQIRGMVSDVEVSVQNEPESVDPDVLIDRLLVGEGSFADLGYLTHHEEARRLWETIIEEDLILRVEYPGSGDLELTPKDARDRLERYEDQD